MDARALQRVAVLLGLCLVLLALFRPTAGGPTCAPPDLDPKLGGLLAELAHLQGEARTLARAVARLERSRKAAAPLPQLVPVTQAEALRRVRGKPECEAAVRASWDRNQTFTAQYAQDWFLVTNYFHGPKGFYLDIGANQPKQLSNTWFLDVCLGWAGICVEADPGLGEQLRQHRSCTVVNTCVDSTNRSLALQAAGIAVGHVVPLEERTARGKVLQCVTLAAILAQHKVRRVDFLSLDVEDHEMHVLQTWPERGVPIDVVLIENEKTSKRTGWCHDPNLLRFPFWRRGYALIGMHGLPQGDDLWVRLGAAGRWRRRVRYPRGHRGMEQGRGTAYRTLLPERFRTRPILAKLMQRSE